MTSAILTGDPAHWRARRTGVKWGLYPPDVLPLWVAEMDAAPCEAVVEAVEAALRRGDTGYALGGEYLDTASVYAAKAWGWSFDPRRASVVADVMTGLSEVVRAATPAGGPLVVSSPVYNAFFDFAAMLGRPVVDAPLSDAGRLAVDALDRAFAEASGDAAALGGRAAYLLCNPQNPTGTVHMADELTALAEVAARHDVLVIADEIHAPLVSEGRFTPYLTVPGGERGVALLSASKAWNLAGLKSALIVLGADAPPAARLHEVLSHAGSHLAQIASIAAWRDGGDWLAQVRTEIAANAALLGDLLAQRLPQIGYAAPEATYLGWLDFRPLDVGDDPAAVLRDRGRVALSSGPSFGARGRGFARINLATSPEILTEAATRMEMAL